jgi:hypothetical protein
MLSLCTYICVNHSSNVKQQKIYSMAQTLSNLFNKYNNDNNIQRHKQMYNCKKISNSPKQCQNLTLTCLSLAFEETVWLTDWLWRWSKRRNCDEQGCQIFHDTMYQNWGKYTKLPLYYQTMPWNIPNGRNIFRLTIPKIYEHFPL